MIPVPIVRWALVGIAFGLSGWFLGANVYPILASVCSHSLVDPPHLNQLTFYFFREAEAKATRFIILVLAVIHFGIAISFKVLFFSYYVVDKIGGDITIPGVPTDGGNTATPRWT